MLGYVMLDGHSREVFEGVGGLYSIYWYKLIDSKVTTASCSFMNRLTIGVF